MNINKDYYAILQVNYNASPEIIDKSYKVLAKKYHPDLQNDINKDKYTELFKEINEAYEILSNIKTRQEYDIHFSNSKISENDFNKVLAENRMLKEELNNIMHNINTSKQSNRAPNQNTNNINSSKQQYTNNTQSNYQENLDAIRQQAYYDSYITDLKNRGYKIRYKKSFKDYLKSAIALIITIIVLFIIIQIPFVRDFLNNNIIFRAFLNLFNI